MSNYGIETPWPYGLHGLRTLPGRQGIGRRAAAAGLRSVSFPTSENVPKGVHTFVQHADNDDALGSVIEACPQVVEKMGSGAPAACRKFQVKGADAFAEIVPLTRTRPLRILRHQGYRPVDESRIDCALLRPEPAGAFLQDALDILVSNLGEAMAQRGPRA